jgi:hypothetical protein
VRSKAATVERDRSSSRDIQEIADLVHAGKIWEAVVSGIGSEDHSSLY